VSSSSFTSNHGPNAKESLTELRADLAAIRKEGWAMQDEELAFGLRSVAAPVRDATGAVIAGANVAVQSRDWTTRRIVRELKPKVVDACHEISALLGHSG
jgi:IclR family pca regulon transcriptional regulator